MARRTSGSSGSSGSGGSRAPFAHQELGTNQEQPPTPMRHNVVLTTFLVCGELRKTCCTRLLNLLNLGLHLKPKHQNSKLQLTPKNQESSIKQSRIHARRISGIGSLQYSKVENCRMFQCHRRWRSSLDVVYIWPLPPISRYDGFDSHLGPNYLGRPYRGINTPRLESN